MHVNFEFKLATAQVSLSEKLNFNPYNITDAVPRIALLPIILWTHYSVIEHISLYY